MYQSRSFYRGYNAAVAKIALFSNAGDRSSSAVCKIIATGASMRANKLSGAARYYQLGIEAAILDAFGC